MHCNGWNAPTWTTHLAEQHESKDLTLGHNPPTSVISHLAIKAVEVGMVFYREWVLVEMMRTVTRPTTVWHTLFYTGSCHLYFTGVYEFPRCGPCACDERVNDVGFSFSFPVFDTILCRKKYRGRDNRVLNKQVNDHLLSRLPFSPYNLTFFDNSQLIYFSIYTHTHPFIQYPTSTLSPILWTSIFPPPSTLLISRN
jgi:hypothetical protein